MANRNINKHYRSVMRPWQKVALWTGGTAFAIVAILFAVLSIHNWNFARDTIASIASSQLNREVRIEGPLSAWLLSTRPRIRIEKLVIENPDWAENRNLAEVETIDAVLNLQELFTGDLVFEDLTIDRPNVAFISDDKGRTNLRFGEAEQIAADKTTDDGQRKTPSLPAIRRFTLRGGEVYVRDEVHKLVFTGTVQANETNAAVTNEQAAEEPFKLEGEGMLNGEPFNLQVKGSALINIRMDEPYAFEAAVTAGKTRGTARGQFEKPFDFGMIAASLSIDGDNLAQLYYLTGLALPFTPPYKVSGDLRTGRQEITVRKLNGKIGQSDISGEVSVDIGTERPKLVAQLHSKSLNLADLSPAFGKGVKTDSEGEAIDSAAPGKMPPEKMFPSYQFEFDRLRSMDADVQLQAASVQTDRIPFKSVNFHVLLNDGVLKIDPLIMTLPQGKLAAAVTVDARDKIATSTIDVRVSDVKLDQFKGKDKDAEAPFDGVLLGRMQVKGKGNSVHDVFAHADGQVNAVVPTGEIRKAFAELTGINVARGLGLLLAKDKSKTQLRCGVAVFSIKDGNADVAQMVFDTDSVLIRGDGKIELEPEKLDLDIEGHSKKPRFLSLRSPITVNGTLRKPAVGIDVKDAGKQVGIAAILGAAVSPLTAALAFIDPGLAKDANCAALLAEAERMQVTKLAMVAK